MKHEETAKCGALVLTRRFGDRTRLFTSDGEVIVDIEKGPSATQIKMRISAPMSVVIERDEAAAKEGT